MDSAPTNKLQQKYNELIQEIESNKEAMEVISRIREELEESGDASLVTTHPLCKEAVAYMEHLSNQENHPRIYQRQEERGAESIMSRDRYYIIAFSLLKTRNLKIRR